MDRMRRTVGRVVRAFVRGRDRLLRFLITPPPDAEPLATGGEPDSDVSTELDKIAKVLAGGFTLVSGLLAFIGIKEGELDRVLRNEPTGALIVFALLGLAVGTGVVAPSVTPKSRVRLGFVVLVIGLSVGIAAAALTRVGSGQGFSMRVVLLCSALSLIAALILWGRPVLLKASVLLMGLLLFSVGLYGAFELSVEEKAANDRPNLTATFGTKDGSPILTVGVKASGLRVDEDIWAVVWGRNVDKLYECPTADPNGCPMLFGMRVGADETGRVDKTVEIPLGGGQFWSIRIRALLCHPLSPQQRLQRGTPA